MPMTEARTEVSRAVAVAATPEHVWGLVSDLPGMGRFSPENRGGRWVGGATGPQVGAVFKGANAQGRRRWSTRSRVVRCEPGRSFAFEVSVLGRPVAEWSYDIDPTADGCQLRETWRDRRGRAFSALGGWSTGVSDRRGFTATSIEQTLNRLRTCAELSPQQ